MSANPETTHHAVTIGPKASKTATELLGMAESMLGWRVSRAGLGPKEEAVRCYILAQYPLLGHAPGFQEIADRLGFRSPSEVQAILERLHSLDLLYLDPESRAIRLAYPFSTAPTRHVVRFPGWAEAKPVYAPCAVDALGIPFMLGRDLSIASSCAYCQKPLAIEVRDRMITACTTAETVLWVGTAYCDHAATSICPTLDFFCSPAHVAAWRQERPGETGHVLDLGEALYVAKGTFEDLLNVHSRTDLSTTKTRHSQGQAPDGGTNRHGG